MDTKLFLGEIKKVWQCGNENSTSMYLCQDTLTSTKRMNTKTNFMSIQAVQQEHILPLLQKSHQRLY